MNDEKYLIRLITWENDNEYPTVIRTNNVCHINELLTFYITAKTYNIPITIDRSKNDKFTDKIGYIDDIKIMFGTEYAFTVLDIYLKDIMEDNW